MYRKEVNEHSPIRILEQSIHGGLGKGNLGVVMSWAGVGKTACLVQIGLDELMRERRVLHIVLDQTMEHVESWYDAVLEDLVLRTGLEDEREVRELVAKNRVIAAFVDQDLWPKRLEETVELFKSHLDFRPGAILVDGYPWTAHSVSENAAMIGALKSYAKLLEAELWMSAQTHRGDTGDHPTRLTPPCDAYEQLIEVAIYLEPHGSDVAVKLLKDHDNATPSETRLYLHPDTLRLVSAGEDRGPRPMPNSAYTLLSGGAPGAEAEFGVCAETWGLAELNFTFEGRKPARKRGLVQLTGDELAQGAVSPVYVRAHMNRSYPDTPFFRKTLQSIWHQVNTAGEVFSVGTILEDDTVKGGTGWAVELARHWHKPVYVYDQARRGWFTWQDGAWEEAGEPKVSERRFAGGGTRSLDEHGREAIRSLFERSFGPAPG